MACGSNGLHAAQRTLVVGAGVSGLTAAIFLARAGHSVEIWEAQPEAGGLLAPVPFAGLGCDRGSHRIHPAAKPLLDRAVPDLHWLERPRRGVILFGRHAADCRPLPYPLRLLDFLRGLGARQTLALGRAYLRRDASLRGFLGWERDRQQPTASDPQHDPGFAAFVRRRVGTHAFEVFYRPYVEKVWGLPADEISATVAKKRISTSHPLSVLREALAPRALLARQHPQSHYLYPADGMAGLVRALTETCRALHIPIHHQRSFSPHDATQFARTLYTGPPQHLLPNSPLAHRGLYLLFLAFPVETLGLTDTFYTPVADLYFGRVSLPGNFSAALSQLGKTVLCIEIPEGTWGPGQDFATPPLLAAVLAQLRASRILPPHVPAPVSVHQVFVPHVYPMYRRGWLADWHTTMRHLVRIPGLFPLGRQGLFLHCNIDHCIQLAADLVQHIQAGSSPAQWLVHAQQALDVRVRD